MREVVIVRNVHSISRNIVNHVSHSLDIMSCTKLRSTSKFAPKMWVPVTF